MRFTIQWSIKFSTRIIQVIDLTLPIKFNILFIILSTKTFKLKNCILVGVTGTHKMVIDLLVVVLLSRIMKQCNYEDMYINAYLLTLTIVMCMWQGVCVTLNTQQFKVFLCQLIRLRYSTAIMDSNLLLIRFLNPYIENCSIYFNANALALSDEIFTMCMTLI